MPVRRILLADADAFFVAVARLVDPAGAGRAPMLIVGGAAGSRGVVCSASYEARAFGVRSAMPISRALRLCPRAMCVPVPFAACARKGREVRAVLEHYTPVVEAASIDEWYLDLSGTERLYHDEPLETTAGRIRADVLATTGLTVSIGGGASRLIAKVAVEVAKPKPGTNANGVHIVPPGTERTFLEPLALADLPLVGPRFCDRLAKVGLMTVRDVLPHSREVLSRWIGERAGGWLYDRVRGIDATVVVSRDRNRSISREETFNQDLSRDDDLERELLRLVVRAAADLRRQTLLTRTISVKLRDADFRTRRASRTLSDAVVSDRVIFETARALLHRLRAARRAPARLLGVALTSLVKTAGDGQLGLFDRETPAVETSRDRAITAAVDQLRARFGAKAIGPGRLTSR